jgi:hypothetical protein
MNMSVESPEVSIDLDILGTVLCYAGQVHVGVAYCIGIETMVAADPERAKGVLRHLHDTLSPAQVAHIVKELGVDPSEVQKDQGGSS